MTFNFSLLRSLHLLSYSLIKINSAFSCCADSTDAQSPVDSISYICLLFLSMATSKGNQRRAVSSFMQFVVSGFNMPLHTWSNNG